MRILGNAVPGLTALSIWDSILASVRVSPVNPRNRYERFTGRRVTRRLESGICWLLENGFTLFLDACLALVKGVEKVQITSLELDVGFLNCFPEKETWI